MKTTLLTLLVLCLTCLSCKKTKLKGDDQQFVGTWRWAGGYIDNGGPDYKLHIMEKGRYKLYKGSKRVDQGRMVKEGKYLEFKSDAPVYLVASKPQFVIDKQQIIYHTNHSISLMANEGCIDCKSSGFEKE